MLQFDNRQSKTNKSDGMSETPIAISNGSISSKSVSAVARLVPLLVTEEAAEYLRVHVKTLQKMAREGRIPCARLNGRWKFRSTDLDHWTTTQQNQSSQPFRVE